VSIRSERMYVGDRSVHHSPGLAKREARLASTLRV
jgi:hypothetical protein